MQKYYKNYKNLLLHALKSGYNNCLSLENDILDYMSVSAQYLSLSK